MSRRSSLIGLFVVLVMFAASTSPKWVYAEPECDGPNPPQPICDGEKRDSVPSDSQPFGWLDQVTRQANEIRVRGWTIDPDTADPIAVHVYADNKFVTGTAANQSRQDVEAVHRGYGEFHGFDLIIPSAGRTICVYGINQNPSFGNVQLGCMDVNVEPFGHLEKVVRQADQILVRGWAIDPDTTGPVGIHIYAGKTFIGGGAVNYRCQVGVFIV